ncbi:MAG: RagB/SusD family nutrient uptake outer membrane protein [Pseudobacter sp.]|uniref:RagB/SusD family nutrient uptake outer membrane protein n=1 Tax=Pseudobacter sp. TaxID=2045420 RepID=UPI003F7FF1F0
MDDDAEMGKPVANFLSKMIQTGFHHWQPNPRIDSEGTLTNTDIIFTDCYKKIARINAILHNVPLLKAKGEPAAQLNRIAGEAHFLRAYYYFTLANLYGKPYSILTASTDLCIPLKTSPEVKDQFAVRNTSRQVYDLIVADLLDAEKELEGANSSSNIRANQAAAQCLLSRVYLFMEEYENAAVYADKVISNNNYKVQDLNQHITGTDFINRRSEEVIFTMKESLIYILMSSYTDPPATEFYLVSPDLAAKYEPDDLRWQAFFKQNNQGHIRLVKQSQTTYSTDDVSDIFLLRLSEAYLNKAEALAAQEKFTGARSAIQELRKKRFKPADLDPVTADGAALVNFIRDERRRELCFENHRWFDLRRYAVNTRHPFSKSIRHRSYVFSGTGYIENGYYELAPYDQFKAAYLVAIANDDIELNQGSLSF